MSAVDKSVAALLGGNDRNIGEFEWTDDVVAVGEQLQIGVYTNPSGNVVIRQRDWPEDDVWIVIRPENVPALVRALTREAGINAPEPALLSATSSGAERQRRY